MRPIDIDPSTLPSGDEGSEYRCGWLQCFLSWIKDADAGSEEALKFLLQLGGHRHYVGHQCDVCGKGHVCKCKCRRCSFEYLCELAQLEPSWVKMRMRKRYGYGNNSRDVGQ